MCMRMSTKADAYACENAYVYVYVNGTSMYMGMHMQMHMMMYMCVYVSTYS